MKKVLIITYYWPPSGGAGVQRWLKFAKYLPQMGWQPVVLTVDPAYASYPQLDESLVKEVSPQSLVYTTRSFELYNLYMLITGKKQVPFGGFADSTHESAVQRLSKFLRGNFLLPDPRRGWNRYAFRRAVELIHEHQIDTVITTSPPHSTQLLGLKLKQKLGIRWIADLRDPWTDIYYYNQFKHTAAALRIDRRYERQVVEQADQLITVSEDVKRLFAAKTSLPVANRITVIPNGYDSEDFTGVEPLKEDRFVITYTGTISEAYPIEAFIEALGSLEPQVKQRMKFRFVGNMPERVGEKLRLAGLEMELTGYVSHAQSVAYLLSTDMLLLVIPRVANNRGILTGKFFEYLASQKPVLAIGPTDGDLAALISETQCGRIFDYDNASGMAQFINQNYQYPPAQNTFREAAHAYSREQLTTRIVQLLNAKNEITP
jgi:glycosyltransferase involved in cell wall biosynthesis